MLKLSSSNFLILLNLISSGLILSSNSLILTWLGLEIISICLPPLITSSNPSIISKINSWKYFMIQCFASSIFVMAMLCTSFSSPSDMNSNMAWMLIFFSMIIKMGLYPFHGWMFQISSSLSWENFLIISTIQKIGPLIVISESSSSLSNTIPIDLMVSVAITFCSISMIFINSSRSFMITSSIVNSMWLIMASKMSKFSFSFFLFIYFIHLTIIFSIMKKEFSLSISSLSNTKSELFLMEIIKSISILSILGMPPLAGFFMKLSVIEQMISQNQIFLSIAMTFSSSIFLLIYFKINSSFFNPKRLTYLQKKSFLSPTLFSSLMMTGMLIFYI